jgi:hypothetical protein
VRDLSLGLDLLVMARTARKLLAGFARLFLGPRQEAKPSDTELAPENGNGVNAFSEWRETAAQNGIDSPQKGVVGVVNPSSEEARGAAFEGVHRTVRKGY